MQAGNYVCMKKDSAEKVVDDVIAKLKEIRLEQNLSHEKLAEKTKLNRSTISLIESRKRQPTLLTCIKIASALDIKLKDIIE